MSTISFTANNLSGAQRNFKNFEKQVILQAKQNKSVNPLDFSNKLRSLGDEFVSENKPESMNKNAQRLAETLVNLKDLKLAGRIYSYLIKFNFGNKKAVEEYATNALIIAKRLHDPVHIMARADDLKKVYRYSGADQDKLLKVLFDQKRALNSIVKDYTGAQKRYVSVSTKMKPVENYELMLASVKIEIAEVLIRKKDISAARVELNEALAIYEKFGSGPNTERIQQLLSSKVMQK